MKKTVIWLFILVSIALLFSSLVSSVGYQKKIFFKLGENITLEGKTIKFIGFDKLDANVWVDGQLGRVKYNKNQSQKSVIGGLFFSILTSSKNSGIILFNITFPFTCGDGDCSEEEDTLSCCRDCGCLDGEDVCISNICTSKLALSSCNSDDECATQDACNMGVCNTAVYPHQCTTVLFTTCTNDDGCCPESCYAEDDTDCVGFDKCLIHENCDDGNPCTVDTCDGAPRLCTNEEKPGCPKDDTCYNVGDIKTNEYCSPASTWFLQKSDQANCQQDYECSSAICSGNLCGEPTKSMGKIIIFVSLGISLFIITFFVILALFRRKNS